MDCEGFDELVLDLLYEDGPSSQLLDEARHHANICSRCAGSLAILQQARQLVVLPEIPVPAGLENSILAEVERRKQLQEASWWRRLDRAISLLGSFAMRPQTAMGALLVLMTGLSLVLLRAKPAENGSIQITEHGQPAEPAAMVMASATPTTVDRALPEVPPRKEEERAKSTEPSPPLAAVAAREPAGALSPAAASTTTVAAPSPAYSAQGEPGKSEKNSSGDSQEAAFTIAMEHYKARRYGEAMRAFDVVANGGGGNGGLASLYAARSARYSSGCATALPRFDAIANRQVGTSAASEATWDAAVCYRELGQTERARQLFTTLRRVAGYRDRVERELTALDQRDAIPPAKPTSAKSSPR